MEDGMNKNHWALVAEEHWERYLPKWYRGLQEAGILDQELVKAGNQASEAIADLVSSGLYPHEAREIVLPQYIFLEPESELLQSVKDKY